MCTHPRCRTPPLPPANSSYWWGSRRSGSPTILLLRAGEVRDRVQEARAVRCADACHVVVAGAGLDELSCVAERPPRGDYAVGRDQRISVVGVQGVEEVVPDYPVVSADRCPLDVVKRSVVLGVGGVDRWVGEPERLQAVIRSLLVDERHHACEQRR